MSDKYIGLRPSQGLHALTRWTQKKYLRDQAELLVEQLDAAIEATMSASPRRGDALGFNLDAAGHNRTEYSAIDKSQQERLLENAIWQRFGNRRADTAVAGVWRQILAYQVPLFDKRARGGWGSADMVALSEACRPSIVEVKRGDSPESVLRPVIEAATYAVAIKVNYVKFVDELTTIGHLAVDPASISRDASEVPLIILAPEEYWEKAENLSLVDESPAQYWGAFRRLLAALAERGCPVVFASIAGLVNVATTAALDPDSLQVVRRDFPPTVED